MSNLFKNKTSFLVNSRGCNRRDFASLTSTFGSELFHGPKIVNPGVRMVELPKENRKIKHRVVYMKYPKELSQIKARYFMRTGAHFKRFYHMTMKDHEVCIVGSTEAKNLKTKRMSNVSVFHYIWNIQKCFVQELQCRTRGFAMQLIIEGKGKRAYFDPEYPHLMCRFSAKLLDFTNPVLRVADSVRVYINKLGTVITLFGYHKEKIRKLASLIQEKGQCNAYTMRGVHFSGFPLKPKSRSAKK